MRRAWLVRAGENAREISALRAAGRIGLRYELVGDVRQLSRQEVEQAIAASGQSGIETLRSRLMRFVEDVHIGDLVVTPNAADHDVWFSMVTGPYEFSDDPAVVAYEHTRTADWVGWTDRNASWLKHKLRYLDAPTAVVELSEASWWMEQLSLRDLPSGPPAGRVSPAPPRLTSTRSASPRAPRAPKPAPPPKPPERVLCAGQCGFQWRPAVLVDGLCPDCRAD